MVVPGSAAAPNSVPVGVAAVAHNLDVGLCVVDVEFRLIPLTGVLAVPSIATGVVAAAPKDVSVGSHSMGAELPLKLAWVAAVPNKGVVGVRVRFPLAALPKVELTLVACPIVVSVGVLVM